MATLVLDGVVVVAGVAVVTSRRGPLLLCEWALDSVDDIAYTHARPLKLAYHIDHPITSTTTTTTTHTTTIDHATR
jgi:hypothetical protein